MYTKLFHVVNNCRFLNINNTKWQTFYIIIQVLYMTIRDPDK